MYAFFQKQLNNAGNSSDSEVTIFNPEELWVTETGQIQTSIKGETTFSLNQKYFLKNELSIDELRAKIKELSVVTFNRKLTAAVFTGKYFSEKNEIEKYFLETDKNDFVLPVYLINPKNSNGKTLIWCSPEGKKAITEHEHFTYYLNEGFNIITADLPGIGELYGPEFAGDGFIQGVPFNYTFAANLAGLSIPGIHTEAIDLMVQFAQQKSKNNELQAISEGILSTAMLVFVSQKNVFSKVEFNNPLKFNTNFIKTEYYDPKLAYHIIPGSLSYFDFEEISKKLRIIK